MRRFLPLFLLLATCCATSLTGLKANGAAYVPQAGFPGHFTDNAPDAWAQTHVIYVYIENALSGDTDKAIISALAEWNYVLNGYVTYEIKDSRWHYDSDFEDHIVATHQGLIFKKVAIDEDGTLAEVNDINGNVVSVYEERSQFWSMRTIMLHEIGHTLGLRHVPIGGTLLYPYIQLQSPCVDLITIRQLASEKIYLKLEHLNYCHDE